ncbi:MAG: hypothetical protein KAW02_01510 [candidate division Zixibacteria bacterium]|nr:hypothetical protein [candidate division Zixibacteria bacterium]
MRSKLSGLVMLVFLFTSVSASGGQKFEGVEPDTNMYFSIENYLLSPFQLTDYNFLGGGAKARGMGGAFFAVSDDPTAASWNPAGLSQLDKAQMNLSFSSSMHRTEYTSTFNSQNWDYSFGDELKYDANAISFASVAIPFKLRDWELVGGVLFQRLADIYQANRYALILDQTVYLDTNYVLPPIDEEVTGKLDEVSISIGGKLFGSLSLGAGINIYTGKFTSDVNFFVPFLTAIEGLVAPDPTGSNGFRFHPNIVSDYSGFNFTFGAMYAWDRLRLGGVVKTPFTLKEDNDIKLFVDHIELGIVVEQLEDLLAQPLFKTDRKWKMPTMFGFGTSYQINSLTLAADLEFRNYSKTEVTYRRGDPSEQEVTTGDYLTDKWWGSEGREPPFVPSLGWRDLTQFRIGAEYMINTKLGSIPIRVGFRNDPKLFKTQLDSSEVYLRGDIISTVVFENDTLYVYKPAFIQSNHGVQKGSWVNGNVFSFGTGIAWSQIKLDITYEYALYDDVEKDVFTQIALYDEGYKKIQKVTERKKFSNKESNKYSRIMISFTGFF